MGRAAGGRRKKTRSHREEPEADKGVPKTFVIHRGHVGSLIKELMQDTRRVYEPHTASRLKVRKRNAMKDFLGVAGPLGVSHFVVFSSTDLGCYVKFSRVPRGPTLTFQLGEYSLAKEVRAIQRRPKSPGIEFKTSPLVVLNNFAASPEHRDLKHMQLMSATFQNMFPPINIHTMNIADCRRIVLFNYNEEKDEVEFRHYSIMCKPVGISRSVRRIIETRIPDLSRLEDISDYLVQGGSVLSDSEADEVSDNEVTLPHKFDGKGNYAQGKSAVRLREIGPRLNLKLLKIEEGFFSGEILYHRYVSKSKEEVEKLKEERERKLQLKRQRREEQERNVERKKEKKSKRKGGKKVSILDGGDEGAEETTLLEDGENSVDEWGEGFSDEEEGMMDEFGATSSVMHSPQASKRSFVESHQEGEELVEEEVEEAAVEQPAKKRSKLTKKSGQVRATGEDGENKTNKRQQKKQKRKQETISTRKPKSQVSRKSK